MEKKLINKEKKKIKKDNSNTISAYKKYKVEKDKNYLKYKQKYFDFYDDVKDKTHDIYDW